MIIGAMELKSNQYQSSITHVRRKREYDKSDKVVVIGLDWLNGVPFGTLAALGANGAALNIP